VLRQGGGSRADCFAVLVEFDELPCPDFVRSRSDALLLAPPCELPPELCPELRLLLCDATNETFVSDMLCRDNKEVCKHSRERLQY
jgi:hypothetical protein